MGVRNGTDVGAFAATSWDPDGPGPAAARLVVAGSFSAVVNTMARTVAVRDPGTGLWSELPGLPVGDGLALLGRGNGELVVGGGLQGFGNVARWTGTQWQSCGSGVNGTVYALAELPNGDLVVGGAFTQAGGVPANRVARWDGAQWHSLGTGFDNSVYALAVQPTGELFAGGPFTQAGGQPAPNLAQWNGTQWQILGNPGVVPAALRVLANGHLLAAGVNGIARWNGSWWSSEVATQGAVHAVLEASNGELFATGGFTSIGGVAAAGIARRTASGWQALGAGLGGVVPAGYGLAEFAPGDIAVAGRFATVDGLPCTYLAHWQGGWQGFGTALDGTVLAAVQTPNGDRFVGGNFRFAGNQRVNGIARWSGTDWLPLGTGLQGGCRAMLALPNGALVVAGSPVNLPTYVAMWHNGTWSSPGGGIPGEVRCLARLPNGDLVAGGWFNWAGTGPAQRVARFDGVSWQPMGAGFDLPVNAFLVTRSGELLAGGEMQLSGSVGVTRLARWDGSQWLPFATDPGTVVRALAELPDGRIVVGGDFVSGQNRTIQYWSGTGWQPLGGGANQSVLSLTVHASGLLFAGGFFHTIGGVPTGLGVFDGIAWGSAASGFTGNALAIAPAGADRLLVGGIFAAVGSVVSSNATTLRLPCLPDVQTVQTACVGPAGPLTAVATAPPLRGRSYASRVTGCAPLAFVAHVMGLQAANTPLGVLDPAGLPNCALLASVDALTVVPVVAGAAEFAVAIPPSPALVGVLVHEQYLQFVGTGPAASLSGSNALRLRIGGF